MTLSPSSDSEKKLARKAQEVLHLKGEDKHAGVLVDMLRHEDWKTRVAVLEALGQLGAAVVPLE